MWLCWCQQVQSVQKVQITASRRGCEVGEKGGKRKGD